MQKIIRRFRNLILTPRDIKERNANKAYIDKVMDIAPQISEIEIETLNRCNGTCPFCPVNVNEPQRPYAKMKEELLYKIIDELSEIEYKGKISLYSNNEPFLDERIIDFYKYAREKLKSAHLEIFTNGSMLSIEKFKEIVNYIDRMVIDNYNDDLKVNTALKEVYEYLEQHSELRAKVVFDFRKQNEIIFSRGGQAPNKKDVKGAKVPCLLPYRQFVIRPTGEVSLCCNDALGKYTLGNLNNQSIMEIWSSKQYNDIRTEMQKNGRKNLLLCKNCDTRTYPPNNEQ